MIINVPCPFCHRVFLLGVNCAATAAVDADIFYIVPFGGNDSLEQPSPLEIVPSYATDRTAVGRNQAPRTVYMARPALEAIAGEQP